MITKEEYEEAQRLVWDYEDQLEPNEVEPKLDIGFGEKLKVKSGEGSCQLCKYAAQSQGSKECSFCINNNVPGTYYRR